MSTLDVYRDWLGVKEPERPLNNYQLLRLSKFEDDPAKIRAHYRKMNAHVRKYASGDYAKQSQELLNELAKAMLCLTDLSRKEQYDESLGRHAAGRRRRSFEEILVLRQVLDNAQLDKAKKYAAAVGVETRDAVVQQKLASADVVMQAYAESMGLPFVDLKDVGVAVDLVPRVPAILARQHSFAPLMVDGGQVLMASPNPLMPDIEEELRLRLQMPVRSVLCTPADIHAAIEKHFPRESAAAELAQRGQPQKPEPAPEAAPKKESGGLLGRWFAKKNP